MSMAWTILLALALETGGHGVPRSHDAALPHPAGASVAARHQDPSRTAWVSRKTCHRAGQRCTAWAGLDEFDTEEVDESWMVHLDAFSTVLDPWPGPASPQPIPGPGRPEGAALATRSYSPLRC